MRCRTAKRLLAAYVDGELGDSQRIQVETHLRACGACRGRAAALRALEARLQASEPVPEVPAGFADRVLSVAQDLAVVRDQTAATGTPRRDALWWGLRRLLPGEGGVPAPLWLAGCCTVALALVLGVVLSLGPRSPAEAGQRSAFVERVGQAEGERDALAWFDPMPPGSIGSAYVEVTAPLGADRETSP